MPYRTPIFAMSHTFAAITIYALKRGGYSVHAGAMSSPSLRFRSTDVEEVINRSWDYMAKYSLDRHYELRHSPAAPMRREWFEEQIRKGKAV